MGFTPLVKAMDQVLCKNRGPGVAMLSTGLPRDGFQSGHVAQSMILVKVTGREKDGCRPRSRDLNGGYIYRPPKEGEGVKPPVMDQPLRIKKTG